MIKIEIIQTLRAMQDSDFHIAFEKLLGIPLKYRNCFKNDGLLRVLRDVYLDESLVEASQTDEEKRAYYEEAIKKLTDIRMAVDAELDEDKFLFICHYQAKIYYQLGVIWMQVDQSIDEQSISKALNIFQKAKESYHFYRDRYDLSHFNLFVQRSYELHRSFYDLDEYSPLARLISIEYNLLSCAQECPEIIDENLICNHLNQLLSLHLDAKNSPSTHAIQEVNEKYNLYLARSITKIEPQINNHHDNELLPLKKKKKLHHAVENQVFQSTWKSKIHGVEQLRETFSVNRSVPSFLRTRQAQDMQAIYQELAVYQKPLLVTKPTGTGKTAEFVSLANYAFNHGLATIVVVPTVTLASQTKQKFMEYQAKCSSMRYESEDIGIYCPTMGLLQIRPITIITHASYVAQAQNALKSFENGIALSEHLAQDSSIFKKEVFFHPEFYSLLIIDEGHHVEGERLYKIIRREDGHRPKVLFSASTLPGEYPKIDEMCERVVTQTIQDAIHAGELSPLQMMNLDFSMYPEAKQLTTSIRQRMLNAEEVHIENEVGELLHRQIGFSYTAIGILKQIYERVPSTRKVMIFTDSIDHADVLATMMSAFFHQPIRSYHSKTNHKNEVLKQFKEEPRSMIVAVGALDEGFDDPDVNLILDFSTYRNRIRRMMQRIGRAERIRDDGSCAIVINVKLLSENLQLMPREVILPRSLQGFIGLPVEQVIQAHMLDLTLPPSINITHKIQDEIKTLNIKAQGAKIVFPFDSTMHDIGIPPSVNPHSFFQSNAVEVAEYRAGADFVEEALINNDPFADPAFDLLFSMFS